MKDILSEIIANKRFEVDLQKQAISIEQLQEGISEMPSSRSMKQALISSSPGIIAEFKRRSPSKGWIKQEARPEEIAPAYAAAGARPQKDGYKKKRVRKRSFPPMQRQVPPPFPSLLMRSFSEGT